MHNQFYYSTFPHSVGEIKIGRMKECDIVINDTALSRIQCM